MALTTDRLKIKLIQASDQVSDRAWNDVIEDIDKKVAPQSHVGDRSHFELWEKNKSYAEGDIIRYASLKSNQYAICISAGQSNEQEPTNNVTGSEINVGTARFKITTIDKGTVESFSINPWVSGTTYNLGSFVVYGKAIYRCETGHFSSTFSADKANWRELMSSIRDWQQNTFYAVGDTVINGTDVLVCKTEHTSGTDLDITKWDLINNYALVNDWKAQTQYKAGQLVLKDGILYRSKDEHRSGNTFNAAKWEAISTSGGGNANIKEWSSSIKYSVGDIVRYRGTIYLARAASEGAFLENNWEVLTTRIRPLKDGETYFIGDIVIEQERLYLVVTGFTGANPTDGLVNLYASIDNYYFLKSYREGNVVHKDGKLYKKNKTTAEKINDFNYDNSWDIIVDGGSAGTANAKIEEWKPSTAYTAGQIVTHNNTLLKVKTAHTSTAEIEQGKFEILYSGIQLHNKSKEYAKDSVVRDDAGNLYFATKDIEKDVDITNPFWQRIVPQANIREWEANKSYTANDIVTHDGQIYQSLGNVKDATFTSTNWKRLAINDLSIVKEWSSSSNYEEDQILRFRELLLRSYSKQNATATPEAGSFKVLCASIKLWDKDHFYPEGTVVRDGSGILYVSRGALRGQELTPANWDRMNSLRDWVENIDYWKNDVVWYDNNLYRANTTTNSSTFNPVDWTRLTQNDAVKINEWKKNTPYTVGEIVKHENGFYYVAETHTSTEFKDDVASNKFKNFVTIETFNGSAYPVGTVVTKEGKLYKALTDIQEKANFVKSEWEQITKTVSIKDWAPTDTFEKDTIVNISDIAYMVDATFTSEANFNKEFSSVKPINASIAQWKKGAYYEPGAYVEHDGKIYRCIREHTATDGGPAYYSTANFVRDYPNGFTISGTSADAPKDAVLETTLNTTNAGVVSFVLSQTNIGFTKVTIESNGTVVFDGEYMPKFFRFTKDHNPNLKITFKGARYLNDAQPTGNYNLTINDIFISADRNDNFIPIGYNDKWFKFPNWMPGINYTEGDIVNYAGNVYSARENHYAAYRAFDKSKWIQLSGGNSLGIYVDWTANTEYNKGQLVKYNGVAYVAKKDLEGKTAFSEDDFEPVKVKKEALAVDDWSKDTDYEKNSLVFYGGSLYRALSNITKAPAFQKSNWKYVNDTAFAPDWESGNSYIRNEIVVRGNSLYRAKNDTENTNFEEEEWERLAVNISLSDWKPNTLYAKGDIVVYSGAIWRSGEEHTSGTEFNQNGWENLSGGGGGSVSGWKQITKLNATAGTKVNINFPETLTFCLPPIDVLMLQAGTQGVIMNSYTFDGGDGSKFNYNDKYVAFDGQVHCNTAINVPMTAPTPLVSGFVCMSDEIDFNEYNSVDGIDA